MRGAGDQSTSPSATSAMRLRMRFLIAAGVCVVVAAIAGLAAIALGQRGNAVLLVVTALLVASWLIAVPGVVGLWRTVRAHELAMLGAHDGIFEWNPVTKRLHVGARLLALLGYDEDVFQDTHAWMEIVHPDDRENFNRAVIAHLKGLTKHFYCEYRVRARNREHRWIAARGVAIRNRKGVATLMAGSVTDITERITREQRICELALNDQLTGLPNRRSLTERLPAALAEAERSGAMVAVLFVDLDRLRDVNDWHGHLVGDELLVAIAQRLRGALRPYDGLVRHGGDELIVLLPGLADSQEAEGTACRLLEVVAEPASFADADVRVTASIGVALYPRDAADAEALLRCAELANHAAKAKGGNAVCFFEESMLERASARVSVEHRLRLAIENGDLSLNFQPQKRLADGSMMAVEALVRWRDGERMVPPDEFLALAEETGLIEPLGQWVVQAAVDQLVQWGPLFPAPLRLAVNLSPRQLLKQSSEPELLAAAARAGIPPPRFELEVTEAALLHPGNKAINTINSLRQAGCRIALDDFGTGYSSLSFLQLLDIDAIKIDKSFIHNLDLAPTARGARNGAAIVSAMIALAHRLGYEVIAEGVESADQQLWLKTLGCDFCQGYYYSPALPASEFAARFLHHAAPVAGDFARSH